MFYSIVISRYLTDFKVGDSVIVFTCKYLPLGQDTNEKYV